MRYISKAILSLGIILVGHYSVHTIRLLGLRSNRSHLAPYDSHIMLEGASLNKIHLVPCIPNFLNFFD